MHGKELDQNRRDGIAFLEKGHLIDKFEQSKSAFVLVVVDLVD